VTEKDYPNASSIVVQPTVLQEPAGLLASAGNVDEAFRNTLERQSAI
jgi:hypothetical protein